jgi:hypothetical protein
VDDRVMLGLGIGSLVVIGLTLWWSRRHRRSAAPAVQPLPVQAGPRQPHVDRGSADREVAERRRRAKRLRIRGLSADERAGFALRWRSVQALFEHDPAGATRAADVLVAEVMHRRGYPIGDFEQRAADVSVEHPRVVEHVRAAHAIARRNARHDAPGPLSAEDQRQAFVDYRALFDDLLVDDSFDIDAPALPTVRR